MVLTHASETILESDGFGIMTMTIRCGCGESWSAVWDPSWRPPVFDWTGRETSPQYAAARAASAAWQTHAETSR